MEPFRKNARIWTIPQNDSLFLTEHLIHSEINPKYKYYNASKDKYSKIKNNIRLNVAKFSAVNLHVT